MVKRSSLKGPLARKIAYALEHGSADITSRQMVKYIRVFKSRYPDSDIELAQPMLMARGYDYPGFDYTQLVDSDVFKADEIVFPEWWGPFALYGKNDEPQDRAMA